MRCEYQSFCLKVNPPLAKKLKRREPDDCPKQHLLQKRSNSNFLQCRFRETRSNEIERDCKSGYAQVGQHRVQGLRPSQVLQSRKGLFAQYVCER
jgi:hypothetical protein